MNLKLSFLLLQKDTLGKAQALLTNVGLSWKTFWEQTLPQLCQRRIIQVSKLFFVSAIAAMFVPGKSFSRGQYLWVKLEPSQVCLFAAAETKKKMFLYHWPLNSVMQKYFLSHWCCKQFVSGQSFQPSLLFDSNAGAYPSGPLF